MNAYCRNCRVWTAHVVITVCGEQEIECLGLLHRDRVKLTIRGGVQTSADGV